MNKKLAVLSGCAALLLTLSACGGDDNDEETEAWARSVCNQIRPQVEQIQSATTAITEASEGDRDPEEVQETDSTAFQDISEAYRSIAQAVDDAGDPPVDDGEQLRREAVRELGGISDSYNELKETIDGLDTSDQAEFADGLTQIADQLAELGESGDDALNELQEGELGEAMARQRGCQSPSNDGDGDGSSGEETAGQGGSGEKTETEEEDEDEDETGS